MWIYLHNTIELKEDTQHVCVWYVCVCVCVFVCTINIYVGENQQKGGTKWEGKKRGSKKIQNKKKTTREREEKSINYQFTFSLLFLLPQQQQKHIKHIANIYVCIYLYTYIVWSFILWKAREIQCIHYSSQHSIAQHIKKKHNKT